MHDPMTVAFEIKYPWRKYGRKAKSKFDREYREPFITIWHKDPCKPGPWRGDDSCGWFMRSGHCDKSKMDKVRKDFDFEWDADYGGWFNPDGSPRLSVQAITLGMFSISAYHYFGNWEDAHKFMRKNLYELMRFAENNIDSMHNSITQRYGKEDREDRIDNAVSVIYPYVCRVLRPWYKHPRWHIHHWKIQLHPWQRLKRRFWDKCCKCGKRGFKGSAMGNWSGTQIWHQECEGSADARVQPDKKS